MTRGGPDFGAVAARSLTVPALDPGELAVRLGSPVAFDRQGTVLAIFGGSALGPPFGTVSGPTARGDLISHAQWRQEYVLRLFTSAADDFINTFHTVPYIGDSGVGIETIWRSISTLDNANIELDFEVDTGSAGHNPQLRWNTATSTWQYQNASSVWTDTPTQPDTLGADWLSIKLTVDPVANTYLRGLVQGVDLGLRDIALPTNVGAGRKISLSFIMDGTGAADETVYLSHLIFTVNEL